LQAVILAAGKGRRLRPVTLRMSKAMAPILGKPIVERVMDNLLEVGIKEFILVVSEEDDEVINYFSNNPKRGVDIKFTFQRERLGMANALMTVSDMVKGDFIVSACDNIVPVSHISGMLDSHISGDNNATLSLMRMDWTKLSRSSSVKLEGDGVKMIIEKPSPQEAPTNIASITLYIFKSHLFDYLPRVKLSPRGEYELQDAIQMMIDNDGGVKGVMTDQRFHLTSAADLIKINMHYLAKDDHIRDLSQLDMGSDSRVINPVRIEDGTIIGSNCLIGPYVYIQRDCYIPSNVTIRNAVILKEACLTENSVIKDEVVIAS